MSTEEKAPCTACKDRVESGFGDRDWRDPSGYDDTADPDSAYDLWVERSWD